MFRMFCHFYISRVMSTYFVHKLLNKFIIKQVLTLLATTSNKQIQLIELPNKVSRTISNQWKSFRKTSFHIEQ